MVANSRAIRGCLQKQCDIYLYSRRSKNGSFQELKTYPPLPDIVLDNLPLIPWAFEMCELIVVCLSVDCLILRAPLSQAQVRQLVTLHSRFVLPDLVDAEHSLVVIICFLIYEKRQTLTIRKRQNWSKFLSNMWTDLMHPTHKHIATPFRGRLDLVFGNIRELLPFHSRVVLPDLVAAEHSPVAICRCFIHHQNRPVNTEKSYVAELESIVEHYVDRFDASDTQTHIATPIRGRPDLVFGNIRELLTFHSRFVLPDLVAAEHSPVAICRCFLQHQNRFLTLYYAYCQNKTSSEAIRKEFADSTPFFSECQRRAKHPLPLGAYLLKPVQRITKYQLLLKELERHCRPEVRPEVEAALHAMLDLLTQINAAIQQLHIVGFAGDLRLMGPLRLQTECDVFAFNKKKARRGSRAQRRHLFLFDGGLVLCKKRSTTTSIDPEFYEYKACVPTSSLNFCEQSKSGPSRFEVWDESKGEGWSVETTEVTARQRWTDCLGRFTASKEDCVQRQRPKSWTSTVSTDSTCSSSTRTSSDNSSDSLMDTNGNTTPGGSFPAQFPPSSPSHSLQLDDQRCSQPGLSPILTIEESHSPEETVNC